MYESHDSFDELGEDLHSGAVGLPHRNGSYLFPGRRSLSTRRLVEWSGALLWFWTWFWLSG